MVAFIPVFNEETTVGEVVRRLPATVAGRRLVTIVVDDGSRDALAVRALEAGAQVVSQVGNLGLGAAVRRGLAEAVRLDPAAVVYLDADLEYFPEDIEQVTAPILMGQADYVVGSRFSATSSPPSTANSTPPDLLGTTPVTLVTPPPITTKSVKRGPSPPSVGVPDDKTLACLQLTR